MEYIIHIPNWHPTPLNNLLKAHWGDASRMKSGDAQMMAAYAYKAHIPKAIGKRSVGITIVLGKGQRGCDPDAYHKTTHDGLKRHGYLKDDNRQWLDIVPTKYTRSAQPATIIHITEVM